METSLLKLLCRIYLKQTSFTLSLYSDWCVWCQHNRVVMIGALGMVL